MNSRIPAQARTTPKIRQEIKDSGLSDREAAKVFNITRARLPSGSSGTMYKTIRTGPIHCIPR